MHAVVTDDWD